MRNYHAAKLHTLCKPVHLSSLFIPCNRRGKVKKRLDVDINMYIYTWVSVNFILSCNKSLVHTRKFCTINIVPIHPHHRHCHDQYRPHHWEKKKGLKMRGTHLAIYLCLWTTLLFSPLVHLFHSGSWERSKSVTCVILQKLFLLLQQRA